MKKKPFWLAIPSWIILGSLAVLIPLFTIMTIESINTQRDLTTQLLFEKGEALIRSFEAGAKTGVGMQWGSFQIQKLLLDTARQPGVDYLIITDMKGKILADSDPAMVGETYGTELDVPKSPGQAQWRRITGSEGADTFEIYHFFSIADSEEPDSVVFLGLDMDPVISARDKEILRTVLVSVVMLVLGFAGIVFLQMIQAYRATRQTLARAEAFAATLVRDLPIGLVAVDREGNIATMNEAAEDLLTSRITDIEGKPSRGLLPEALQEAFDSVQPGPGNPERMETERVDTIGDRSNVPLEIMASVLRGENGEHLGALAIFRDLTEIRQLRDEIARSQRLASLGSLAAGVAHEIRNPLSSIKGFATYFRDRYKDNPEDSGTAQIMIEEVDRLNRVISQLLELSRPSGLRLENMDLASIIRHVLVLTGEEAREKGLSLRADLPEKPVTAPVDHDKIEQALLNIVLNALQASESGGSVTVALKREPGGRALVSVADTGKGISREDLPRIFDPYFTTKPSGTGLGLAIVHKIVEAHGGEIRAVSEKGQGTTMEIYIPVEGEK